MRYNADFSQPVFVHPADYQWLPSPAKGVERMMLDRIGNEVARATTIVRYAPNSHFPEHAHDGGEEILVLDGVFGDEHGKYPKGTYLRNPVGTSHSPAIGAEGAVILVKLHQFDKDDKTPSIINTAASVVDSVTCANRINANMTQTAECNTQLLHQYGKEIVCMQFVPANTSLTPCLYEGGAEYFVVEGTCIYEKKHYPAGSWLRFPSGFSHSLSTGKSRVKLWHKNGHLPQ
ncbi:cupin domain-containing protein [Alteromonas sp. CI.11.F.A3]|uniref:cupin domain-containing protein n=1 Tax=Alteromonas sp. CI.11.F.A3 TaxID=3079555 RepID=UPI0029438341|nr:cupin domain-containing protein [Alteromonas sp. CI.11.F.A3]WOI36949.1 cupin domain-containing protein [Alteromonas sp. CI.11.F.A3]